MKQFESFLAPQLEEYLLYRRRHGFDVQTSLSRLRIFDRYLRKTKTVNEMLPPLFFLEMQADIKAEPHSVNTIISAVRVFFKYLIRQGYYTENPLQDVPHVQENTVIPFVFTPDETDQLLTVVSGRIRHTKQFYLKDLGIYLVILLLARCGLRISEPLRLQMHHYRSIEKTIYKQKFDGATAGSFNANIIARDLGLKDKTDITSDDKPIVLSQDDNLELARKIAFGLRAAKETKDETPEDTTGEEEES